MAEKESQKVEEGKEKDKAQEYFKNTIEKNAAERDETTRNLLGGLVSIPSQKFVEMACKAAKIKEPKEGEPLAKAVFDIQRWVGFDLQDNSENCDAKFGPVTLAAFIKKLKVTNKETFETFEKYLKKTEEVYEEKKEQRASHRKESNLPSAAPAATVGAAPSSMSENNEPLKLKADEVVLIGDSLTTGYRGYIKFNGEKIPTAHDLKYVRSGKSSLAMLKDFDKLNRQGKLDKVKAIVLFGGANDLFYRTSAEIIGYLNAMKEAMMHKNPPARVVLVTLPPVRAYKGFRARLDLCHQRVQEINMWIRRQAGPNVKVVDLYNQIQDPQASGYMQRKYNGGDGLHLSGKAYKALAGAVQDSIQKGKSEDFEKYA